MDILTLIFIAIGLSMDSFAVSVSNGLTIQDLKFGYAVIIALFLSIFQGLTPALGWLIGIKIEHFIADYDHWIAFLLLGFIGLNTLGPPHSFFKLYPLPMNPAVNSTPPPNINP